MELIASKDAYVVVDRNNLLHCCKLSGKLTAKNCMCQAGVSFCLATFQLKSLI